MKNLEKITFYLLLKKGWIKQPYEMSGCSVFKKGEWLILYSNVRLGDEFGLCKVDSNPPTLVHKYITTKKELVEFELENDL